MALLAVSDKDSIATVKNLEAKHGSAWLEKWLALRDVNPHVITNLLRKKS